MRSGGTWSQRPAGSYVKAWQRYEDLVWEPGNESCWVDGLNLSCCHVVENQSWRQRRQVLRCSGE